MVERTARCFNMDIESNVILHYYAEIDGEGKSP